MTALTTSEADRWQQQLAESEAQLARLDRHIQEQVWLLNQLVRVSAQLSSTLNLRESLQLIIESAKDIFQAEACSVLLVDEPTGDLVFEVAVGEKSTEVVKHRVPAGKGIAGRVVQTREPMLVPSVKDSPYFYSAIDQSVGFQTRNMLALPLLVKGRVIGVMEIINSQGDLEFTAEDLTLATALASQAAVAIDNARLYQELSDALVAARMSYRL